MGRGEKTASRDRVDKARLLLSSLLPSSHMLYFLQKKIPFPFDITRPREGGRGESGGSSKIASAGNFLRKTHHLLFATAFGIFSITAKRKFLPSSPLLSFPKNFHGRIFVIGKKRRRKETHCGCFAESRSKPYFFTLLGTWRQILFLSYYWPPACPKANLQSCPAAVSHFGTFFAINVERENSLRIINILHERNCL